ncbi:MAG: glucodextranase DOMON-like domain-containing protein, partial [Pseudomonadota bacterium]
VHGNVDVLADDTAGPGLLAYRRTHNDDQAIVLLNTADHTILASNIDTGLAAGQAMTALLAINHDGDVVTDANGQLNLTLAPRAVLVLVPGAARSEAPAVVQLPSLTFDQNYADAVYEQDFVIAGQIDAPNAALKLIINGNLDRATDLAADDAGRWQASVPVRDLGERDNYLEVYSPATGVLSERVTYATRVTEPTLTATVIDSPDDAFGPTGNYVIPQHGDSGQQREIQSLTARAAGSNLELTLTMAEVSNPWLPPNGFDNVLITVFFDLPGIDGQQALPHIQANMPDERTWNLAHFATGWFSFIYSDSGASAERQGEKLGVAPRVTTDRDTGTITFLYEGERIGVNDWRGASVYITTWESTGEGVYIDVAPEPSEWFFGGASADSPKIMDDVFIALGTD